jgi:pimeloyl-ACP methyl ester carboxylesterase
MGREDEVRAVGGFVADAMGGAVGVVADMHRAISVRVDTMLPPTARPISAAQKSMAQAVYGGVAGAYRATATAGAHAVARKGSPDSVAPSQSRVGRVALPAMNGLWGDTLASRRPELSIPMAVRNRGSDVGLTREALTASFPQATGSLVLFLHGLGESDESWGRTGRGPAGTNGSYGDRLRSDLDCTPVFVRYNSGLRVSDNGRTLDQLLSQLTAAWPVPVREVSLVGHSMGGLVTRSACHVGEREEAGWVRLVRSVITLGTPHLGAPLEKITHVSDWLLSRLPETEPLARVLRVRSRGIRDLRFGSIVEADWAGHDPDEFLRDRCTEVPFLDHATYYFVAASLTSDPQHPAGRLIGDGLVRYPSAAGVSRNRRIPFELHNGAHLGGVGHLSLLNHPDVYERLRTWLS